MALLPIEEALRQLRESVKPTQEVECIDLDEALGRTLAADHHSHVQIPSADTSAMDGYAVAAADLNKVPPTLIRISQRIAAGAVPATHEPGTAVRLFTGSQLPPGADAVIRQEDCTLQEREQSVSIGVTVAAYHDVRPAGQNVRVGDCVVSRGTRLLPQHLALLASVGVNQVHVYRKLRVAMLCTGDELVKPGYVIAPGQMFSSNDTSIRALVERQGMAFVDIGLVEDTPDATKSSLLAAAAQADVVVSSGGVSVGEEDHIRPVVEAVGSLDLWQIAIKPGKPLAYGYIGQTPFFGLPGNPVSSFVTYLVFVQPYLLNMQGGSWNEPEPIFLPAAFSTTRAIKRTEYACIRLINHQGETQLEKYPSSDSSMIQSLTWADGLAVIEADTTVAKGDRLATYLFGEMVR